MSAFANPYLIPELIMNPVPEPGEPPKTKVMVHGLPGSKFTRQHAPTDAAFEHIKDGIRNLAQINSPLSSFGFRCWKQRLNQRPLRRRQIARIGKLIHPTTILHAFSDRFLGNAFDRRGVSEQRIPTPERYVHAPAPAVYPIEAPGMLLLVRNAVRVA